MMYSNSLKTISLQAVKKRFLTGFLALLVFVLNLNNADAETLPTTKIFDSITAYVGQGADHNLKQVPAAVLTGDIKWEKSYFTSVGLTKDRGTFGQGIKMFEGSGLASVRHGYEIVLVQHRGLQSNTEIGAAYMLKTPDLNVGPVGVNFGTGLGLSHAFGTPSYEDGPINDPGRRYRTQLLILFDLEWRVRNLDNFSFIGRVHHRSGAYGLIAPRNVGSNFLAAGVRYAF